MPAIQLTTQERSAQRAAAHALHPVVIIGAQGLTPAVLKEINVHLDAHQLIKIKVAGHEREDRQAMLDEICEQLSCAPVQHLGKTLIVFRPKAAAKPAEATRAVRAPNAPHIPKKQAAEGAVAPAKRRKPAAAPRTTTARKPAATGAASHRIPRKAGSALTLRARSRARQGK